MNILELARKKVLEEESTEDDPNVTVTSGGNYICQ